ncbi:PEP-CTERM sorting domain-containing protein [Archangium minus]|uniref:PEP-CTERM sorting domain-containing protein n=1 Tax=Archangium minus TaxID=83450 RepID=A0ABY9WKK0_9BACT|nr:PEP-CTERM sorting domain-containing protein [Archangium minus]
MRKLMSSAVCAMAVATSFVAVQTEAQAAAPVSVSYTFAQGTQGWTAGFADLPTDYVQTGIYNTAFGWGTIPDQSSGVRGLLLQSTNRSDDVFMYITKKIDASVGLAPNKQYTVYLNFDLATDASEGSIGIGGSPANSVYVKAGAVNFAPALYVQDNGGTPYYFINVDKGYQANSGADMEVIGNLAKPNSDVEGYQLKHFEHTFTVTTNAKGEAYLIIGTDSGYEGFTRIYYTNIQASFY